MKSFFFQHNMTIDSEHSCNCLNFSFFLNKQLNKVIYPNLIFIFFILFFIQSSFADPFSSGDVALGENLHNQNCKTCHDGMVPGGDGNELYLSELRVISTSSKLISQVEFCANQNGLTWFEEEIESVSKYLNDNFYNLSD